MFLKKVYTFLTNTIYKKLVLSIFIFVGIPVIVIYLYTFSLFEKILIEKATDSAQNSLAAIGLNINNTIDRIMTTTKFISMDPNIINALKNKGSIPIEDFQNVDKLFSNIQLNYFDQDIQITIIPTDGDILSTWSQYYYDYSYFYEEKWYKEITNGDTGFIWIAPQKQFIRNIGEDKEYLISVATGIYNETFSELLGIIMLSIKENSINEIFISEDLHNSKGKQFLTSDEGLIIVYEDDTIIGENINDFGYDIESTFNQYGYKIVPLKDETVLLNFTTIKKTNWKLIEATPYSEITFGIQQLIFRVLIISFFVFIFIILVFLVISRKITSPIKNLVQLMKKIEKGNLDLRAIEKGNDETYLLSKSFNKMMDKQNELIIKIAEEEKTILSEQKKKDAIKLEMLKAQINPHFLFNTLNTIKWTAMMSGAVSVSKMVKSLGNLLEMSIERGGDTITLKEEIKNVIDYIYIQKIRFDNRFETDIHILPELEKCLVPKFILQPLVENSIMHGFEDINYIGIIKISAVTNEDNKKLKITIEDNGLGIDSEDLKKIMSYINNTNINRLSGIGVANVNERIRLLYGSDFGINIKSNEKNGTQIEMVIPYTIIGDENDEDTYN